MRLVNVYRCKEAKKFLYEIMRERSREEDKFVNISHRKLPTWGKHCRFVDTKPYAGWYLIQVEGEFVGTIYLSKNDEIGIVLLRRFRGQGHGSGAITELMRRHKRRRLLANINPMNERSIRLFQGRGFTHLQNTYELRHDA